MSQKLSNLPALIDRVLFFGNPEIFGAQISPNGELIAFIKPFENVRNIWVKRTTSSFDSAKPLTNEKQRPIPMFFWSHDSKHILFVKDNNGDENFNVYAVEPYLSDRETIPESINLTNSVNVQTQIYELPKSDPDFIYIGINDRDPAWHDLYKVKLSNGSKTLLIENKDRLTNFVFDNEANLRLALRSATNGDTEILRVDNDTFEQIYTCNVFESCRPLRFHRNNQQFYMITNRGERDLSHLVLFNPETLEESFVEQDPNERADLGNVLFSEVTEDLICTTYEGDKVRRYWKNKGFELDYGWLKSQLPQFEISITSTTKDESLWIILASGDVEPGRTYLFDRAKKGLELQYVIREQLPRENLAKMESIRFESSDGLEIPSYLTLPVGIEPVNLPLVVVPHGGPWHRDSWIFHPIAQFLANRGYAVLQINFRGSTGFGKQFIDAGNKQWGDLMQDDITWGVSNLVDLGIADKNRVGIMGGSYGGYATLAGVTFTPELYAAAVAIVAPSSLLTLLNSIPPYWEGFKTVFLERMGNPETADGKAQLDRQSPLNHVDKITTPLMIVQGANDPRVKKAEADQIVAALNKRKYPVVYLLAEDEGHGFQRPVNNMAMYAETERFFSKYLGGRCQTDMPAEVQERLKELTVEIADLAA